MGDNLVPYDPNALAWNLAGRIGQYLLTPQGQENARRFLDFSREGASAVYSGVKRAMKTVNKSNKRTKGDANPRRGIPLTILGQPGVQQNMLVANAIFSNYYRGIRDKNIQHSLRQYAKVTLCRPIKANSLYKTNNMTVEQNPSDNNPMLTEKATVGGGNMAGYLIFQYLPVDPLASGTTSVWDDWKTQAFSLKMPGHVFQNTSRKWTLLSECLEDGNTLSNFTSDHTEAQGERMLYQRVVNPGERPDINGKYDDVQDWRYLIGYHCVDMEITNPTMQDVHIELSFVAMRDEKDAVDGTSPVTVGAQILDYLEEAPYYENGGFANTNLNPTNFGMSSTDLVANWRSCRYHPGDFKHFRRNVKQWGNKCFTIGAAGKLNLKIIQTGWKRVEWDVMSRVRTYPNLTYNVMMRIVGSELFRTAGGAADLPAITTGVCPGEIMISQRETVEFLPYSGKISKRLVINTIDETDKANNNWIYFNNENAVYRYMNTGQSTLAEQGEAA